MDEKEERAYIQGSQHAWHTMLAECLFQLGEAGEAHHWRLERHEAIQALREVCAKYGDTEWDDDLRLADIIEKHLHRVLDRSAE
jgi:hypothetical protein